MKKTLILILACMLLLVGLSACATPTNNGNDNNAGNENYGTEDQNNNGSETHTPDANDNQTPQNTFDDSRIIAVFTREDGSGTRDAFVSITGVGTDMYVEAVVISETNEILTKVEENDYAISYVSVGSLSDRVKALSIDGVFPSNETIMDGTYKLQRPLLVCVNAEKEQYALVQDFISFMLSAQGQEISATKWTKIDVNAPTYTSAGLSGTLKVGGSTSVDPLMQSLRQAYIALNPGVEIEISGGGSGVGITEAISGILDIGMSSRELRDNEKADLTGIDIALDGVAVIVNPANPVAAMSIEQVKVIFTGEVTRWSDAG